jgi:hypothetical protein
VQQKKREGLHCKDAPQAPLDVIRTMMRKKHQPRSVLWRTFKSTRRKNAPQALSCLKG